MIERLAIPAWKAPPRSIEEWAEAIGEGCVLGREPDGSAWIEVAAVGLEGFALIEGENVVAIDFDLNAPDPAPALDLLETAARTLGWELHEEDGEDD